MPWNTIFRYSLHALAFGVIAGAVALIFTRDRLAIVATVYLAMVTEIIGLRLGLQALRPFLKAWNLVPLKTTLAQWATGPGALFYHVAGNLLWFVPLGALLKKLRPRSRWFHALLAGAALSLFLETCQYLLGTGFPDIDDVLLNAAGALIGWLIAVVWF